ncbi:MAG: hypothetical protein ACETWK_00285, partial [Candidatus Aminicenantaceae bacterium]
ISLKTNRLMPFLKRLLHRFALRNDKASRHFGTKPIFYSLLGYFRINKRSIINNAYKLSENVG